MRKLENYELLKRFSCQMDDCSSYKQEAEYQTMRYHIRKGYITRADIPQGMGPPGFLRHMNDFRTSCKSIKATVSFHKLIPKNAQMTTLYTNWSLYITFTLIYYIRQE